MMVLKLRPQDWMVVGPNSTVMGMKGMYLVWQYDGPVDNGKTGIKFMYD
jgi:hypothetical protein